MVMEDLTGRVFGRLTVLSMGKKNGRTACTSLCECGNETVSYPCQLLKGRKKSCGCWHLERLAQNMTTHGKSYSKTYSAWAGMVQRCTNPKIHNFRRYGGRGISVCGKWLSFEGFFEDMGDCPERTMSLDRIDVNGNYEPSNCRWATVLEQANNRRDNVNITFNGKTLTVTAWAIELGMCRGTLNNRLFRFGWPVEKALTQKLRGCA